MYSVSYYNELLNEKQAPEWIEVVRDLGLGGQKEILHEGAQIPFPRMTNEEANVFSVIFPKKDNVKSYDKAIIPFLELLEIQRANDTQAFSRVMIWYNDLGEFMVVGLRRINERDVYYKICRYDNMNYDFDTYKYYAFTEYKTMLKNKYVKQIAEANEGLNTLEERAEMYVNGDSFDYFYL